MRAVFCVTEEVDHGWIMQNAFESPIVEVTDRQG